MLPQDPRYKPQDIITLVVPVGIVKIFEVINISHRERVSAPGASQPLIEGPAVKQAGQLINIRVLPIYPVERMQQDDAGKKKAAVAENIVGAYYPGQHEQHK